MFRWSDWCESLMKTFSTLELVKTMVGFIIAVRSCPSPRISIRVTKSLQKYILDYSITLFGPISSVHISFCFSLNYDPSFYILIHCEFSSHVKDFLDCSTFNALMTNFLLRFGQASDRISNCMAWEENANTQRVWNLVVSIIALGEMQHFMSA